MRFRNKAGFRLSFQVPGRKGLTFVEAGGQLVLSAEEMESMKADKLVLDSYLEPVQNEAKAKVQEPKVDEVQAAESEVAEEEPKAQGRRKRK